MTRLHPVTLVVLACGGLSMALLALSAAMDDRTLHLAALVMLSVGLLVLLVARIQLTFQLRQERREVDEALASIRRLQERVTDMLRRQP